MLVTGASGGVGSIAVELLAKLGYTVAAATGKLEQAEFLNRLGAKQIDRDLPGGLGRSSALSGLFQAAG